MTGLLLLICLVLLALGLAGLVGWARANGCRPDPFPGPGGQDVMDEIRSTGPIERVKAHEPAEDMDVIGPIPRIMV